MNEQLLSINKKNSALKINTIYNNTVLIDIMNDFDIHTHVLYLNDAKDEEDSLKTKGIITNIKSRALVIFIVKSLSKLLTAN